MKNARIVIIGTGPAGIAAATKLLELGFEKVTLLEAENRIGGRIYTIPFAANVVDLGGQWCYGQKDNVVYELVKDENLVEHSREEMQKFMFIRSNKRLICYNLMDRLKAIYENILEGGKNEMLTYKGSVGKFVTDKFFKALEKPENSDINMTSAKQIFESFKKMENSSNASDTLDELSAKGIHEYWDCEGDLWMNWKEKGYLRFLQFLMKSTETNELGMLDQKVKLGKQVEKITWSREPIQIKCKDNEIIEADHAIVTVSLGVLKEKHSKLFEPQLPAEKIRAIETIGFGTINKMYLEFPDQFWYEREDWPGFTIVWRDEELAEIRGTSQAWLEDVIGFYPVVHQPKTLCGWMIGPNGRYMETLPEKEVIDGCMFLLRKFLYWKISEPVAFKRSTWSSSENFRGSYSFQSVKAEEANAKPSDLASPLTKSVDDNKPIVLFAGEATSYHHYGTVQGAVETGWREAKRLADLYVDSNNKLE
ncbi:spermine oxidase-like [Episyrphus balteatus]|uniref:spermine oxidase-like n=1 Tax=Episyrphus balteatus TaxID=286459 RepID=UPI002484FAEB|nr:spermine oxidase-like [Episyrphus balteatus]